MADISEHKARGRIQVIFVCHQAQPRVLEYIFVFYGCLSRIFKS